jgi:hypothetical protein
MAASLLLVELTTARLLLAPLDPGRDAQMLHAAYSDADVMRWWHTPLRVDVADTRRDLTEGLERAGAHLWVVRETEKPVGLALAHVFGWWRRRRQSRPSPSMLMSAPSSIRRTGVRSQREATLPHHQSNSRGECESSFSGSATAINWL